MLGDMNKRQVFCKRSTIVHSRGRWSKLEKFGPRSKDSIIALHMATIVQVLHQHPILESPSIEQGCRVFHSSVYGHYKAKIIKVSRQFFFCNMKGFDLGLFIGAQDGILKSKQQEFIKTVSPKWARLSVLSLIIGKCIQSTTD